VTGDRSRARRFGLIAAVAALVVAADQLTKTLALDRLADGPREVFWTLRLNLEFNTGVAFSQARGSTAVVTVVALGVLAVLVVVAARTRGVYSAVALGLVIGGAMGNLVDRVVRDHGGAVIDFIDFRWFPVFNVADAAVTIGVVLVIARSVLGGGAAGRTATTGDGSPS